VHVWSRVTSDRQLEDKERPFVAKQTILISDKSGQPIEEGKGAVVTIRFNDARRGIIVLDLTDEEAEELGAKGRKQARRGRRPSAQA
jgi:hypothetical protein